MLSRLAQKSGLIAVLLLWTGMILTLVPYGLVQQGKAAAQPLSQFRGVWISTVDNIDWPSRPGLPASVQQQEFVHLLDTVQQMNMNAVIVQVKPVADAFYPSQYGPWSAYLTGTQGKDPGYNPLAFMVSEAHKRHLEFHAWFNPYRLSMHDDIN
ncbi:MAG TPA: family 10 glycosylhydrolase, partial [Ktedonobacteraceae bacterium]